MVHFRMNNIMVEQFAIVQTTLPEGNIQLKTELSYNYSQEGKSVSCKVSFVFSAEESKLLIMIITCYFEIKPEDWQTLLENGEINLPKDLMEMLAVQTIGASRGILFCKTEGTDYNRLILPPINVREILAG